MDEDKNSTTVLTGRGGVCHCRHCRRQCKIFASGVNFSIFTHFFVFLSPKLLKLAKIDGVKVLAWNSGGVKFWTNFMSEPLCHCHPFHPLYDQTEFHWTTFYGCSLWLFFQLFIIAITFIPANQPCRHFLGVWILVDYVLPTFHLFAVDTRHAQNVLEMAIFH